jgi:hypothetical protein
MRTRHDPSDVTDAKWASIEPHIPVRAGGRPRKTDPRDVVDAVFYISVPPSLLLKYPLSVSGRYRLHRKSFSRMCGSQRGAVLGWLRKGHSALFPSGFLPMKSELLIVTHTLK